MAEDKKITTSDIITAEAVGRALAAERGEEAKLLSWSIEDFCQRGDNFATFVTSIKGKALINGNEEQISYVTKLNPCRSSEIWTSMVRNLFDHEITFIKDIGPRISSYLPAKEPLKIPTYLDSSMEDSREYMICNDLRLRGFKMHNKKYGLDFAHCSLLLSELARLHAGGWIMIKKNGLGTVKQDYSVLLKDFLKDDLSDPATAMFQAMLTNQASLILGLISDHPEYSNVGEWLTENKDSSLPMIASLTKSEDKFTVITHGDCWNNNFLYRYNENNEPVEVMLVDLQICRFSSLCTDLVHCIYSSTVGPMRTENLSKLLHIYYDRFCDVLKASHIGPPFTYEELVQEYETKALFGLIIALSIGPMVILDKEDIPDFDNIKDEEMEKMMADMMTVMFPKIKQSSEFVPRILGLMDDFKDYVENGKVTV